MTDSTATPPSDDSKSKRKREMQDLQKLGETLVNLTAADLAKIPLEGRLEEAIHAARTIKEHGAKRRQLQFIGKLMRHVDPAPIQEALASIQGKNNQSKVIFHQVERWRERLIAEGDTALQEFVTQYPDVDHQHMRQLIRNSQKENTSGKNMGASTELFRYLRTIIEK